MRLHHVGYVVRSIDESVAQYRRQFDVHRESLVFFDPQQDVRVKFVWNAAAEHHSLEFIEPASEKSPVHNFLSKYGGGLNHLCYEVPDLAAEIASLTRRGALLVRSPRPAVAFENRPVAFLVSGERLLIELLEGGTNAHAT